MKDEFYHKLLDNLYDGVYFVNLDREITYWNKAAERLSGYEAEEVLGRRCADNILRHVDERGTKLCVKGCPLAATMKDGKLRETDVYMHHKEGHRVPVCVRATPFYDEEGKIIGSIEIFSNNAKNAHALQTIKQLQSEVLQDSLTGIGNRRFANLNLDNLLYGTNHHNMPFGLLFVDLDHFKEVNDTWGHNVGDKVLVMIAKTLLNGLRALDLACRWGGEEFVVLLPGVDHHDLNVVAERLRMLIENSWIENSGQLILVTASFGGALSKPGDTVESIVNRADVMLYKSKKGGRNQVSIDRNGC